MNDESKKFGSNLYFMNDKNVHDGLIAKRIKAHHIRQILKNRGLLVSLDSTKDELVELMKKIRLDFFEYVQLSSFLENPDRKESKSRLELKESVNVAKLNKAVIELKKKLQDKEASIDFDVSTCNKMKIEASYIDVDYSLPPMRQKVRKKAVIEISINDGESSITYPATKMGKLIKNEIIEKHNEGKEKPIKPVEIDFQNKDIKLRTKFFTELIEGLENYEVYDVLGISLKRVDEENNDNKEAEQNLTGSVRNAILTGKSILTTKIYENLPSTQYYIYKIIWKVRHCNGSLGTSESDCYTIEAQFDDPDKGVGLKLLIKSKQKFTRGKLNITPDNVEKGISDKLSTIVHKAATKIYESII